MGVEFEWDAEKANHNKATHCTDFREALTVFADPFARIFEDEEHSEEEPREIMIGHSAKGRLILVCFRVPKEFGSSAPGRRHLLSVKTMKKTSDSKKRRAASDAMRSEYRFDYKRAKPNKFAEGMTGGALAVVLEPDVAAVFQSSDAVNALLRSVIAAMPDPKR